MEHALILCSQLNKMKQSKIQIVVLVFFSLAANYSLLAQLKTGTWRGLLTLSEKKNEIILPFNFNVAKTNNKTLIEIINAEEKIKVDEITYQNDSVFIKMPVFDSEFRLKMKNDTLVGNWINHARTNKNVVPFEAYYNNKTRFITSKPAGVNFAGKYEVSFNPEKEDEYKAIGVFTQSNNKLTGTFLTETGDYRFLEGVVQGNNMALSCFDGSHAFLFFANSSKQKGLADSLSGEVFYGISGKESWTAIRNEKFELKNPESITYLKNPNEKIYFTFKNTNGKNVSLSDEKFKDKPVIIQLMGSWCPNCMDETAYLAKVYKQYQPKGLEIIALAYERTSDPEKAKQNVLRLKNKYQAEYEFLITGLTGKDKAAESLPFFNSISAFPTTIILDRNHQVVSIYTGFNGPATGKAHEVYKKKTENLIQQLLLKE